MSDPRRPNGGPDYGEQMRVTGMGLSPGALIWSESSELGESMLATEHRLHQWHEAERMVLMMQPGPLRDEMVAVLKKHYGEALDKAAEVEP